MAKVKLSLNLSKMFPMTETTGPWHVGWDDRAHYIRDGRALCGFADVSQRDPKQLRAGTRANPGPFIEPCCRECFRLRGEMH